MPPKTLPKPSVLSPRASSSEVILRPAMSPTARIWPVASIIITTMTVQSARIDQNSNTGKPKASGVLILTQLASATPEKSTLPNAIAIAKPMPMPSRTARFDKKPFRKRVRSRMESRTSAATASENGAP